MPTLMEVYSSYPTNPLFPKMVDLGAPWSSEDGKAMDNAYFMMWSGIKTASNFLMLNSPSNVPNSEVIANILWTIYGLGWTRLWEALQLEYNPIENYNLSEKVDRDQTDQNKLSRDLDYTSTIEGTSKETTEANGTENVTGTSTTDTTYGSTGSSSLDHGETITSDAETDDHTYGFNSEEKVPTSVQISTGTDTHSGTDTTTTKEDSTTKVTGNTTSDTTTSSTGETDISTNTAVADKTAETHTIDDVLNEQITRTRSGNIGVTTTQQMLLQEYELRKNNFFEQVFEDVDKYLTLSIYIC